jgi:molecular chaperone IbpA
MTKNDYEQLAKIPVPNVFSSFDPFSVGFDKTFKALASQLDGIGKALPGYPPYNIKKVADDKYVIEMAVAGFSKTDIEITLDGGKLIINGKTKDAEDADNAGAYYFYKGIAERAFTRTFTLADSVEIKNAEMVNGILKVWLENFIPEHKKPKKIEIKD